jgi:hypothetical protein
MVSDVPSMVVFCRESIEYYPGIVSRSDSLSSSSSSSFCSLIMGFVLPGTYSLEPVVNATSQASSLSL